MIFLIKIIKVKKGQTHKIIIRTIMLHQFFLVSGWKSQKESTDGFFAYRVADLESAARVLATTIRGPPEGQFWHFYLQKDYNKKKSRGFPKSRYETAKFTRYILVKFNKCLKEKKVFISIKQQCTNLKTFVILT